MSNQKVANSPLGSFTVLSNTVNGAQRQLVQLDGGEDGVSSPVRFSSGIVDEAGTKGIRTLPSVFYSNWANDRVVQDGSTEQIIIVDDASNVCVGDIFQSNDDISLAAQWRYVAAVDGVNITLDFPFPSIPATGSLWNFYKPFFLSLSTDVNNNPVFSVNQAAGGNWRVHVDVSEPVPIQSGGSSIPVSQGSEWDVTDAPTDSNSVVSVPAATASTMLLAGGARADASVYNDSSATLYVLCETGGTASTSHFTKKLAAGEFWQLPHRYCGDVVGIWSAASGNALVTNYVL